MDHRGRLPRHDWFLLLLGHQVRGVEGRGKLTPNESKTKKIISTTKTFSNTDKLTRSYSLSLFGQLSFFKDDHNFAKAQKLSLDKFVPSAEDNNVKLYISWGLKKQDRDSCHKTDFACEGKTVWDESFDLNPPPAQLALLVSNINLLSLSMCLYFISQMFHIVTMSHF